MEPKKSSNWHCFLKERCLFTRCKYGSHPNIDEVWKLRCFFQGRAFPLRRYSWLTCHKVSQTEAFGEQSLAAKVRPYQLKILQESYRATSSPTPLSRRRILRKWRPLAPLKAQGRATGVDGAANERWKASSNVVINYLTRGTEDPFTVAMPRRWKHFWKG